MEWREVEIMFKGLRNTAKENFSKKSISEKIFIFII
jgi:hypothetical protein